MHPHQGHAHESIRHHPHGNRANIVDVTPEELLEDITGFSLFSHECSPSLFLHCFLSILVSYPSFLHMPIERRVKYSLPHPLRLTSDPPSPSLPSPSATNLTAALAPVAFRAVVDTAGLEHVTEWTHPCNPPILHLHASILDLHAVALACVATCDVELGVGANLFIARAAHVIDHVVVHEVIHMAILMIARVAGQDIGTWAGLDVGVWGAAGRYRVIWVWACLHCPAVVEPLHKPIVSECCE